MGTHNRGAALSANDARDSVEAYAALSRLARERAALDAEEGRWLLRLALGGPRPPRLWQPVTFSGALATTGAAATRSPLSACANCGGGRQLPAGEIVPVDAAVVDMATCDAQHLGELLPRAAAPANENASRDAVAPRDSSNRAHVDAASGHEIRGAGPAPHGDARHLGALPARY